MPNKTVREKERDSDRQTVRQTDRHIDIESKRLT